MGNLYNLYVILQTKAVEFQEGIKEGVKKVSETAEEVKMIVHLNPFYDQ